MSVTTVEGALVLLLLANSGVTSICAQRIHAITDPQNIARPKLTYQRLRTDRSTETGGFTNGGPTGHAVAVIQIDAWADELLTAKQLATAARKALNGFTGTQGGIWIDSMQVTDEREIPAQLLAGQGKPIQRQMLEIRVQYQDS